MGEVLVPDATNIEGRVMSCFLAYARKPERGDRVGLESVIEI